MLNINDSNSSHYSTNVLKSKGFGQKTEDRVSIPNDPEWVAFKETLEGSEKILSEHPQNQAKISAALVWYRTWLILRPKPPTKGEKRIAQQICSDFLGVTRFEFVRTAKALNNAVNRCSLEVAS